MADFESMEELDSDKKALEDFNGTKAVRDIVQVLSIRAIVHFPNYVLGTY